jgi:hypothetical protein
VRGGNTSGSLRGGRPPEKSNFYCHPGRAGGSPRLLAYVRIATLRAIRLDVHFSARGMPNRAPRRARGDRADPGRLSCSTRVFSVFPRLSSTCWRINSFLTRTSKCYRPAIEASWESSRRRVTVYNHWHRDSPSKCEVRNHAGSVAERRKTSEIAAICYEWMGLFGINLAGD